MDVHMDTPESGSGDVTFWLAGNSVNGDGAPTGDAWNRLSFSLGEGEDSGSVEPSLQATET